MFLGKARKIASLPGDDTTLLGLSVTRDGKEAMVLRRSDQQPVFVGDFSQPPPRITNIRRLTLDERTNYPHAWTADSRAVIFESNRNGNFDRFKQYVDRRTPEPIVATPSTEILAQLSPDGRFVLYAAHPHENQNGWYYKPGTYTLMRVPVEGGTPQEVPIGGPLDEFRCAVGGGRCVLRTTEPGEYRTYYDLDPVRGKGRELARTKITEEVLGIGMFHRRHVRCDSEPRFTRGVHPRGVVRTKTERSTRAQSRLERLGGFEWVGFGGRWAWVVRVRKYNCRKCMLYVYPDGRFDPLGDIQGWAVPSPDGRTVAFLDRIVATNAWLMERW